MKTYPKNLDNDTQVLDVWKEVEYCFQEASKAPDDTRLKTIGIAVCLNAIDNSTTKFGDTRVKFSARRRSANRVPEPLKGEVLNAYGDGDWFDLEAHFSEDGNGNGNGNDIETALYSGKSFETLWIVWRSWMEASEDVSYQIKRKDG